MDLLGGVLIEVVKGLIAEAKKFKDFEPLSKDLASTMERLIPLTEEIGKMQKELDFGSGDLKELVDIIKRARVLVDKCKDASRFKRTKRTRDIEGINKDLQKFCGVNLLILMFRNQLKSMGAPVFKDLCSVPKLDKVLVGLEWPLLELKKKLLDDFVVNLVVSALPGCGKTALVTYLCHDEAIKGKFNHIFYSVVSSSPNFRVIVQDLLQHNGYKALSLDSNTQAANALNYLLAGLIGNGILLVLDDVWSDADWLLSEFHKIKLPGLKVLVTSRSVFPSFGPTYPLNPLEDKDAKNLLIQLASPLPHHANPDEFEHLLNKILKRCNGIPLVIEVVGASLKGQPLYIWKGQVESWSEWETLIGNPTVLKRLEPSFSVLQPHLKECFMDMGLFLEDQKIRASIYIDIWLELYGKGTSNSHAYMKYLNDLASQNLLKLIPLGRNEHEDGFFNELLVTQHDVLRELAIYQSESEAIVERKRLNLEIRQDNFPDWCLNSRSPIINASLLSISTDDLFSSNWVEMDFPSVKALVLHLSSSDYELPNFIATMKKLKVLIITNHGFMPARLSRFLCLSSLPNLKRIRLEKVSITLMDIVQLKLVSLKKLALFMCSFGEVFYDTEEIDVSKALPSLQEIDIDSCYDLEELPFWICEVVSLKTLSITKCNKLTKLPEAIKNLSKLEILRLSSCINLAELPETTDKLENLWFLDISNCLGLKKLPLEIGKLEKKLKKISMMKCSGCELPDSVKELEDLEVKCNKEVGVLWERFKPKMRSLRVVEEETEYNLNFLENF